MKLNIRETLNFGGLLGSKVVAGEEGLDKQIESVSVLEVAEKDNVEWMLENQLYITSFYAISDDVGRQKEVINALINSKCCGLVLCYVGTWVRRVHPEIIELCDQAEFPLIQARNEVSYIEIMEPIIDVLHNQHKHSIEINDYSGIRNEFLNVIVNEDNADVIFKKINSQLGEKVSYYDTYARLMFSDRDKENVEEETEWVKRNFNHILYLCSKNGYTVQDINGPKVLVLIRAQKKTFGLLVMEHNKDFEEKKENGTISAVVIMCSLVLQRQSRLLHAREDALDDFLTDLLVWNFPNNKKALQRADELGLNIINKRKIMVININSIQRERETKVMHEIQNYIKHKIVPIIHEMIDKFDRSNWVMQRSDVIIVFFSREENEADYQKLGANILRFFESEGNLSVSIGTSNRFESTLDIPAAYDEAFHAATMGRDYYGENLYIEYNQVYFMEKLRTMDKPAILRAHCDILLKPLLEYDEKNGTDLVETLGCLLEKNCNVLETASVLFIHKNTVLQRKNKIINILGYSPFEMPNILNFLIVYNILRR